jgi:hypothetical protein
MLPNINKQIVNKITSDPDLNKNISNKFVQDTLSNIKKYELISSYDINYENKEATASGGSGQYSAPLFGDMKEEETKNTGDLDFYKSKYNSDDNSFTAAYKIIDDTPEKFIEVLNIHEIYVEGKTFFDKKFPYDIKIFKFRLPKSQIEILDEETGKEGFKFIRIPYWLVKKEPEQYKIKRKDISKRLDNKYNAPQKNLEGKVDDSVVEYISTLDGDKQSLRKIGVQKDGEITKAETKEATGSGSSGSYETPAAWAKSSSKKNWRGARKTQIPGGKFVEVRKKCQKFPYCNQGDINALKLSENKLVKDSILNVSKKFGINEDIVKAILLHEMKESKTKRNK